MIKFEDFCIEFTKCMNEMASELGGKWTKYGYSYSPFLPDLPIDSEPIDQNSANEIAIIIHNKERIMSMFNEIVSVAPYLSNEIKSARISFASRNYRSALRDIFACFDGFIFHNSSERPNEKNISTTIQSNQCMFKNIEIYSAWLIMQDSYKFVNFKNVDDTNRLIPNRHLLAHGMSVRQYTDYDFVRIFVAIYVVILNYKDMPLPINIKVAQKVGE